MLHNKPYGRIEDPRCVRSLLVPIDPLFLRAWEEASGDSERSGLLQLLVRLSSDWPLRPGEAAGLDDLRSSLGSYSEASRRIGLVWVVDETGRARRFNSSSSVAPPIPPPVPVPDEASRAPP